jgi:tRNA G10  N-methylase Trm11
LNLRTIYVGVNKSDPNRKKNDFYPTAPIATFILNKFSSIPDNVIEPCAGRGNISIELERCGKNVKSFDLNDYDNKLVDITTEIDYLELPKQIGYDGCITNPPYHKNLPLKMLKKAIVEYDYVAFFLRLTFLEGKERGKFFREFPPTELIITSDRIRFHEDIIEPIEKKDQLGGMICYAWFIFDKNSKNETTKITWVTLVDQYDEWWQKYDSLK